MANFTPVYPVGAPYKGIFTSAAMNSIDARWAKIPNWLEGSDHTMSASSRVVLRGDGTNSFVLVLPAEVQTSLAVQGDATLTINGTSGHPAVATFGQFSTATWNSGATATWANGSSLILAASATFTVNCTENVESGGKVRVKSGATLQVDAGASSTNASALGVQFTGTQPAKTADPGANNIAIATNQIKAWGLLYCDGSGNVDCLDGLNVASVVAAGSNRGWTVTLARAMASTNCAVEATYQIVASGDSINCWVAKTKVLSTSGFDILLQKSTDGSYADVSAASVLAVSFSVKGRQ